MSRRSLSSAATTAFTRAYQRNLQAFTKAAITSTRRITKQVTKKVVDAAAEQRKPPPGPGDWIGGMAMGPGGTRGYHLYRPPGLKLAVGEKLPLMVMLHGCDQTGREFATSTRMNRIAARGRFLVLYPEQDRLHHPKGCWNWYDTRSGHADREAATLMAAIDQVCLLYAVDRARVAVAGLSAGAGMAALLATRHPHRFAAVAMHSGVAPGAAQSTATAISAMHGRRAASIPTTAVGKAIGAAAQGAVLPPLLVLHGDADHVVASNNARSAAMVWASATAARPVAERLVRRGQRQPMRVTDFKRGRRVHVTLCEIERLGHAWSGGLKSVAYSDPAGPDATRLVWAFAEKQFKAVA